MASAMPPVATATPSSTAMAARKIRAKAQKIAAHLLEVSEHDLEWDVDRFRVKGVPGKEKTMKEIAWAAYNNLPEGMEPGLEAVDYYDPPNFTYPFGTYLCVVDIDKYTGETSIRRFYALDDCGTRINPMIIEGQVHGGLTEALALRQQALAKGFAIMVGCMVGSSLAMAPAVLVAQGAAITDLDGPLLLAEDRQQPLLFDRDGVHPAVAALWG